MTDTPFDDVPAWDPFRVPASETHPVKASGGAATVTYRKWSGRERLAYEDAMTSFLDLDGDGDGEAVESVRLGRMRLIAATLTMRSSTGFPALPTGDAFDVTDPRHVEQLDAETVGELLATALRVQPLPQVAQDTDGEDAGSSDDGDPSPTPSTPQGAAASPSPVESPLGS